MKKICIIILIISSSLGLNGEKLISEINITGLTKTKESVIHNILKISEGSSLSDFDEEEFSQKILKTNIMKKPTVEYKDVDNGVALNIHIEDKWTIIPVPMVNFSSDDQSYGMMLIENNFLGLNKSFHIMGEYSTKSGLSGFIRYREEDLIPGVLSGDIRAGFGNSAKVKYWDIDDNLVGEYSQMSINLSASIYYNISSNTQIGLSIDYDHYNIGKDGFTGIDFNGENSFIESKLYYSLDLLKYSSVLNTGFENTSTFRLGVNFQDEEFYYSLYSKSSYTHSLNNLYLKAGGVLNLFDRPYLQENSLGLMDHSRTMYFMSIDNQVGGSIEAEYLLLNFSWASFSASCFFEGGSYSRDDSTWRSYYGPGASLKMYLTGISVPALGIHFGYNLQGNYPVFGAAIAF